MECEEMLKYLRDDIVRIAKPQKLLLFSQKHKLGGELCSVKLCVIIPNGDARQVEHHLYVEIESEIPFDVLVYTELEWSRLLKNRMSFAAHIQKIGRVLYEAK